MTAKVNTTGPQQNPTGPAARQQSPAQGKYRGQQKRTAGAALRFDSYNHRDVVAGHRLYRELFLRNARWVLARCPAAPATAQKAPRHQGLALQSYRDSPLATPGRHSKLHARFCPRSLSTGVGRNDTGAGLSSQRPTNVVRGDLGYIARDAVLTRHVRGLVQSCRQPNVIRGRVRRVTVIRSPFIYKKTREQFGLRPRRLRMALALPGYALGSLIVSASKLRTPGEATLISRS